MANPFEWVPLALNAGYNAHTSDGHAVPAARLECGSVRVVGIAVGGSGVVATLDPEFRPPATRRLSVGSGAANTIVNVQPNGDVVATHVPTPPNIIPLEGAYPL